MYEETLNSNQLSNTPVSPPPVLASLTILAEGVEQAFKNLTILEQRLSLIRTPLPRPENSESALQKNPVEPSLARKIDTQREKVYQISQRISEITNSLEI
jgi:hypothetical protein